MGHLFVVCGPPGAGKTTLLKWLHKARPGFRQVRRTTTREQRAYEGDTGQQSLEYFFLPPDVFSLRLKDRPAINLIEWNGNYYATHRDDIQEVLDSGNAHVLLEDIPSAVHLKTMFGTAVTVVFLFVERKECLLDIPFAGPWNRGHPVFDEWIDRLRKKYLASTKQDSVDPNAPEWVRWSGDKIRRAIPDLASMAGRIRDGEDIHFLPNLRDQEEGTFKEFGRILDKPIAKAFISHSTKDKEFASRIADALDSIRVPYFLAERDLETGTAIVQGIGRKLQGCSHLIAVLSASAVRSQWVHFEIGQASALRKGIVPFLTTKLRVPEYLQQLNPATTVDQVQDYFQKASRLDGR